MKVARFNYGYRIKLTDAEFRVIVEAVRNGLGDDPADIGALTETERSAWAALNRFDAFDPDDDRRA